MFSLKYLIFFSLKRILFAKENKKSKMHTKRDKRLTKLRKEGKKILGGQQVPDVLGRVVLIEVLGCVSEGV